MKLHEIPVSDIFIGLNVISAIGTRGKVTSIDIDPRYQEDNNEKNPLVTIAWDNMNSSIVSPAFMGKIEINEKF